MGSDLSDLTGVDSIYILLQGIGVLAVGFTLLTIAPTYIPSPEVSLYTLIETVLGPVWVFLGGYESPSIYAVCGGAILLIALAVHRYRYLVVLSNLFCGDSNSIV
jgi:drug/metabolite transporter (DMT)-like permease